MAIVQLDFFLEKIMTEERVKPLRDEFIRMLLNTHSKLGDTTGSGENEVLAQELGLEIVNNSDTVDEEDASSFTLDDYSIVSADSDGAVIITDEETQIEGSQVSTLDNGVEDHIKFLDEDSSDEDLDGGFAVIARERHVHENSAVGEETMSEDEWAEDVMVGK